MVMVVVKAIFFMFAFTPPETDGWYWALFYFIFALESSSSWWDSS
jgi:hypothetical protein